MGIFLEPVDGSLIADYYDVVKSPMCFQTILSKIEKGEYTSPKEFYDDVLLICDNCYLYNVEIHPEPGVAGLGVKMENAFLRAWGLTAFAQEVPPREQRKLPRMTPVAAAIGKPKGRPGSAGRAPAAAAARSAQANIIYMTPEMENDLVTALNTPEILEANMEAVVQILTQANEMGVDEDGEPSLDLEKVSAPTKRKLYDLVVKKPNSVAKPAASSGFRLEDDDYDPEEEDI